MRLAIYASTSMALLAASVLSSLISRPNFYSAAVQLSSSSLHLLVLTNSALAMLLLAVVTAQRLLFGGLRAIETEHLHERAWLSLTETGLAMTVFREDVRPTAVVAFAGLLAAKAFHWLLRDRVDSVLLPIVIKPPNRQIDQLPHVPPRFHVRILTTSTVLALIDCSAISHAIVGIAKYGPSIAIMFLFEFTLLLVSLFSTFAQYLLTLLSPSLPRPKSLYQIHLSLISSFFNLVLYIGFFLTLLQFYGLPIHILRDVYVASRQFLSQLLGYVRYRKATKDMETRYPDAVSLPEDDTCIVCRETMGLHDEGDSRPKKLNCGHVLHLGCLRGWLERVQSCPICRRSLIEDPRPDLTNPQQQQPANVPQNPFAQFRIPENFRQFLPPIPQMVHPGNHQINQEQPQNVAREELTQIPVQPVPSVENTHIVLPAVIPLNAPPPGEMSPEQLERMERDSRFAISERIRIMHIIQRRVEEGLEMLVRLESLRFPAGQTPPEIRVQISSDPSPAEHVQEDGQPAIPPE
ncbi:ERAD-associated E3 ubiquitin-protein ligase HRD1 [Neolecta irregularis DAH-3]|uniref:RING-type E3 ubiquitin transferase n=1 Tax=Neolecta irregularis (strain DAH-3) TaxID=1198029 RepID=A0A1U7LUY8_NEOID|nr:ERAD-associated E3 ubiquitin-protein ligase HRD1 [Neolecta irregularis DAH-3]|eukprot:OLL26393.1 ERAD-associated E3 ubiquitin-protein ligase HRD1 [Neolecta irregularis DAH-3]